MFVPGSSFLDPRFFNLRSWYCRPLRGRLLLVLFTGYEARCLRVFQGEGLGGGWGWFLRIYLLSEGDGVQVKKGLTGGLPVLFILRKVGSSRVAKWSKRKYKF
jgi:hypothetical protein